MINQLKALAKHMTGNDAGRGTPVQGLSAVIDTTTAVTVITNPGAGVMNITWILATNIHATEDTVIRIQDNTGTPVQLAVLAAPAYDIAQQKMYTFNPPLKVPAGKNLMAIGLIATTGDVHVTAGGYALPETT
jgi:hypothetical protein